MQRQNNKCTSVHLISMEPPQKKKENIQRLRFFFTSLCVFGGPFKKGDSSSPPAHPASQSTTSRSCLKRPDGCQLEMDVSWSKRLKVLLATKSLTGPVLIQRTVAYIYIYLYHEPQNHEKKGFGQLETRLFTIKTTKNVAFGGPWYKYTSRIRTCLCFVFGGWTLQEGPNSDQNKGLHLRIGLAVSPGDGFFCGWQVMVSWIPRKYCI